jgi:hypothetical protein
MSEDRVDPVLLLLGRIRGQVDEVMELVKTQRIELEKKKGVDDATER